MTDLRTIRGGPWLVSPKLLRASNRHRISPLVRFDWLGFRVMEDTCLSDRYRASGGGSWLTWPGWLRSATRLRYTPSGRFGHLGFRVVEERQHG